MLTNLRGKFVLIFLIVTVSTVIISTWYSRIKQREYVLERAEITVNNNLNSASNNIQTILEWVNKDLFILRDLPQIQSFFNSTNGRIKFLALKAIESAFLSISNHHQIFHQIRLLSIDGQEIVRINSENNSSVLVPTRKLQFKGDRYYAIEGAKLQFDEVYTSPLDLNIEHGKVERPIRSVIRFITPVFDNLGNARGLIVLNVKGKFILDILALQQQKSRNGEFYFLTDSKGYYLFHPEIKKRFSRYLDKHSKLSSDEPALTKYIQQHKKGVVVLNSNTTSKETLFAFKKIFPESPNRVDKDYTNNNTLNNDNFWYLISSADDENLLIGFDEFINGFIFFTLTMIFACIMIAIFVAYAMTKPVIALAKTAENIKNGDLSARTPIYTNDEMGELGLSFNDMATHLESSVKSLKFSEAKYREIFEHSRDCLFVTDANCILKDINSRGRKLFNLPDSKPLSDFNLTNFINPADKLNSQQHIPKIHNIMSEYGFIENQEVVLTRHDGSTRSCLLTATARHDKNGKIFAFEGILRDISKEKELVLQKEQQRLKTKKAIILAEERERKELSQLLHEELAQNLALVSIKISEIENGINSTSQHYQELKNSKLIIDTMINQVRTMIFDLYPAILDDKGLIPAIKWYANHFSRQTGIEITILDRSDQINMNQSSNIYIYRSCKELLHNTFKHANTKHVIITFKKLDSFFRIIIDDDGSGFDSLNYKHYQAKSKGIGLLSIKEWVEDMNGEFTIESQLGGGARVILDIPLENRK